MELERDAGSSSGGSIRNLIQSRRLPRAFTPYGLQQTTRNPEPKSDPNPNPDPVLRWYEWARRDFALNGFKVSYPYGHPRPQPSSSSTSPASDSAALGKAAAMAMAITTPACGEEEARRIKTLPGQGFKFEDDESILRRVEEFNERSRRRCDFDDDELGHWVDASIIRFGPHSEVVDYLLNLAVKHYNDNRSESQKICHPQLLKYETACNGDPIYYYITFAAYDDDDVAIVDHDKLGVYQAKLTRRFPVTDGSYAHFCRRKAAS